MAALAAGRAGARVILADEDFVPGGRLLAERLAVGGQPGADWAAAVGGRARRAAERAGDAADDGRPAPTTAAPTAALERVGEHVAAPAATRRAPASGGSRAGGRCSAPGRPSGRRVSGQRPPGRDAGRRGARLPQPLGGGAAARAAVFTARDDGWRTAADLAAAGVEVAAIVDVRGQTRRRRQGPWRALAGGVVVGDARAAAACGEVARSRTAGAIDASRPTAWRWPGGWNPARASDLPSRGAAGLGRGARGLRAGGGAVPGLAVAGAAAGAFSTHARARRRGGGGGGGAARPRVPRPRRRGARAEDAPRGAPRSGRCEARGAGLARPAERRDGQGRAPRRRARASARSST